jgi:hypothetical protein
MIADIPWTCNSIVADKDPGPGWAGPPSGIGDEHAATVVTYFLALALSRDYDVPCRTEWAPIHVERRAGQRIDAGRGGHETAVASRIE